MRTLKVVICSRCAANLDDDLSVNIIESKRGACRAACGHIAAEDRARAKRQAAGEIELFDVVSDEARDRRDQVSA